MIKKLEYLREKIDIIDNKIFDLIDKRLKKIYQISKIKYKYQIPSYIKDREEDLINIKINNNKRLYVSNKLIKDILKRIMYESYNIENKKLILKRKNKFYNICFIGGRGKMGNIFKNLFIKSNYKVYEINSTDWNIKSLNILKKINVLIISVPISIFKSIIEKIIIYISKKCILIDLSSNKSIPIKIMLSFHKGPILGLHPMFGPDIISITKQTIIVCHVKYENKYNWILKQFKLWGILLIETNYNSHDNYMSYIQSLRYFIFLSYGFFIKSKNIDLNKIFNYSSQINKLYLSILGKFFKNDINLYLEIIFSLKENIILIKDYVYFLKKILILILNNDKEKILYEFNETKYFIRNNIDDLCKLNNLLINNIDIYK